MNMGLFCFDGSKAITHTNSVRSVIPILVFLAGLATAIGQTVDFNQNRTFLTPADRLVYRPDGGFPDCIGLTGTNFVAQLYYEAQEGATSLTPVPQINRFRNVPATDSLAGTWVGATRTLTGRTFGDNVTLQVYAWDSNAGATFEAARAAGALWAVSAPFNYTIPAPGSAASAFYIDNFRSFGCVPEPSVVALGFLGAFAIVLLKRPHSRKPNAK